MKPASVLFLCVLLLRTEASGAVPATHNPQLPVVEKHYLALEYDEALESLEKTADWVGNDLQDLVWIDLMRGVLYTQLEAEGKLKSGAEKKILDAFERALGRDPHAQLPVKTARRVQRLFAQAQQSLGIRPEQAPTIPPPPPPPTTTPPPPQPEAGPAVGALPKSAEPAATGNTASSLPEAATSPAPTPHTETQTVAPPTSASESKQTAQETAPVSPPPLPSPPKTEPSAATEQPQQSAQATPPPPEPRTPPAVQATQPPGPEQPGGPSQALPKAALVAPQPAAKPGPTPTIPAIEPTTSAPAPSSPAPEPPQARQPSSDAPPSLPAHESTSKVPKAASPSAIPGLLGGLALGGAGGVFLFLSHDTDAKLRAHTANLHTANDLDEAIQWGKTSQIVGWSLIGVGAACLLFGGERQASHVDVAVTVTGSGAGAVVTGTLP